jgi:hypothetical protein
VKRPKPSRLRNALAAAWIGGAALAVALLPYIWRDNLPSPFWWTAFVAGTTLTVAVIATGAVSRLSLLGLLFVVLGFAMVLFAIGLLLAPAGIVLYAAGIARARLIGRRTYGILLVLVAATIVSIFVTPAPVPGLLFAAAAIVVGVGLACGHGEILGAAPWRGERST